MSPARSRRGCEIGALDDLRFSAAWEAETGSVRLPRLLPPIDLQCVKASGVTFAVSAVER